SSSSEYELAIPADWQVAAKQRLIPLPDPLFEQYDLLECRCFMGLFPEIKRAWITVNHRLFLWNYEDDRGVFVDTIKHVLVVATPLGAFLLGVGYDGGKLAGMRGGGSGGEVTLYATQISVPADGVAMTSMCGTSDGRVFMSGSDGALYELAYQSEDGWLTKKAKKINLTSTIASGGCRLYFSTVKRTQRYYEVSALAAQAAEQQPECFNLVHVRLPPDLQPAMARSMQNFALRQALNVHTAFYGNGTALLAHTWSEDHDSIICDQFESLGQFTAVVSLPLACSSESGPSNDALAFWSYRAPENDSREAVYHKRMWCYKCIIELLDKRRTRMLNAKSLAQLPSNDALFHFALFQFALYDWLLDNDQSALLFQMSAPFVEKYLSLELRTLDKCDMLWHFYIHKGQFGKASLVQHELAGSGRDDFAIDLARRIEYLSLLIGNGKIAIDAMRGGKAAHVTRELLSEEEEINELATLLRKCEDQLEIQQQLRALGGHETPACMLNCCLFTMAELCERFAEPLQLWDAMLLILKASNHDDAQMVEEICMTILRTILDDAQRMGLMVVTSKERPGEYVRGYVGDTLVHANVPHWAVFEPLNTLYIRNAAGAQKDVAEFLVREIAALTTAWMDSAHSASADSASPSPDKDSMPVMAVDEALS
ncbi:hypothetical protein GGI24_002080, partial [Coemansia furcata]